MRVIRGAAEPELGQRPVGTLWDLGSLSAKTSDRNRSIEHNLDGSKTTDHWAQIGSFWESVGAPSNRKWLIRMVAGGGFEPPTFGL